VTDGIIGQVSAAAAPKVTGDFAFEQVIDANGDVHLRLDASNVSLALPDPTPDATGNLVAISGASGSFIASADGLAGYAQGSLEIGVERLALNGQTRLAINTTDETVSFDNDGTTVSVEAGPYFGIEVLGATGTITLPTTTDTEGAETPGPTIDVGGDFLFQRSGSLDVVVVDNLFATFGGQGIQGGRGLLVINPDGLAGEISGQASVETAGASIGATIGLTFNTTPDQVMETITLDGDIYEIDIAGDTFEFYVAASGIFQVGDFATIEGAVMVMLGAASGTANVFIGQGPLLLPTGARNPDAAGILLENAAFNYTEAAGGITLSITNATASIIGIAGASFDVATTLSLNYDSTGPTTIAELTGSNITIMIGSQEVELATFLATKITTSGGSTGLAIDANGGKVALGSAATGEISTTDGAGTLLVSKDGVAGQLSGTFGFIAPGGAGSGSASGLVAFNSGSAIDEQIGATRLTLPNGPSTRVQVDDAVLTIYGQTVRGDFTFESDTDLLATGTNLEVEFDAGGTEVVSLTNGAGNLTIDATGVSGSVSGQLQVAAVHSDKFSFGGDFEVTFSSLAGGSVSVAAVDASATVLGQQVQGDFTLLRWLRFARSTATSRLRPRNSMAT